MYLKQQLQGYRFRSIPTSALEREPLEFINGYVAREARVRQCDVIRTDKAWFLVGPVRSFGQNPFSARRFLNEDSAMAGKVVYFNVVAIPTVEIRNEKLLEHLKWSITRIVTLQRQISAGIIELVREMEQAHIQKLGPMLQQTLNADGTELEEAIEKRMLDYEQALTVQILAKIPKAVTDLARSQDDFEYLFHHLRQFIIQLACDVRDFSGQFATTFSVAAKELDLKMMSFLSLLDKRKDTLFVMNRAAQTDPLLDPKMPFTEFKTLLDVFEPEMDSLKLRFREAVTKAEQPRSSVVVWIEKVFKLDKRRVTPDMIQRDMEQARKKCLVGLIRICKRYPKITVYVELEGLNDVDTSMRHYALPAGPEGVGQLPKLIRLYEDSALFSAEDVRRRINFSVFNQKQKWGTSNAA